MNPYNNRFFEYLKKMENESLQKKLVKEGLAIANPEQFLNHLISAAKASYWAFILLGLFVLYQLIVYAIKLIS